MKVDFSHGLGDCVRFAHQIAMYTRRGHDIEVHCTEAMAPIMRAGGASITTDGDVPYHPFNNPSGDCPSREMPWRHNKPTMMLGQAPMPELEMTLDVFNEYNNITIDMESQCEGFTYDIGKDAIVLHPQGDNGPGEKNIDSLAGTLVDEILKVTDKDIVVIDSHGTWPDNDSPRVTNVKLGTVQELYLLLRDAALFVGVDSGPLAMLRCTDTQGLGVWTHHHPAHYCSPRKNTAHLVPQRWDSYNIPWRIPYNIVRCETDSVQIAEQIRRMLAPRIHFSGCAADVQFQQFVEWTTGGYGPLGQIDRADTFGIMFEFLKGRDKPVIVETGTIRAQDDFCGAGYSTYLFGVWVSHGGGALHTVDINEASLEFAKRELYFGGGDIHYHHMKGMEFLVTCGPIDLFYSDGEDTDSPTHAEGCLAECRLAEPKVVKDGMIAMDDTVQRTTGWIGKGALAVPWLLDNGWKVVHEGYQVILQREKQ